MTKNSGSVDKKNSTAKATTATSVTTATATTVAKMIGEISPAEIAALKEKHGRIRCIKVIQKDGNTSVGYFKYPDRDIIALAMGKRGQHKIIEAGEAILDNCMLAGDPQMKSVDALRVSVALECYELIDFLPASSEDL